MSLFDLYYRKEIRRDELGAKARANPAYRARMAEQGKKAKPQILVEGEENLDEAIASLSQELLRLKKMRASARAQGGSSQHIDGRITDLEKKLKGKKAKKKKPLKEEDPGMPADPMGGGAPMPAPAAPAAGGPAKAFIKVAVDAANFLAQKENELSGLPSDSPELAMVRNAEGLLKDYTPIPEDDDRVVASKIALLAKELRNLEGGASSGEIATYLRALAGKLDEFRATIDVGNDGGDVLGLPDEDKKEEPAPAPKEEPKDVPPTPQERQQDLAKGLELNVK